MRKMLLAVGCLMLLASGVQATTIEVIPGVPTGEDDITLVISGTWNTLCVPRDPETAMHNTTITIELTTPDERCSTAIIDWEENVNLGKLAPGSYDVEAYVDGEPLAGTVFEVQGSWDESEKALTADVRIKPLEEDGELIGGVIVNEGNVAFEGMVGYSANLAFNKSFGIDNPTRFAREELFPLVLLPGQEVEFFVEDTDEGHRFHWPETNDGADPVSVTVSPPAEDTEAVENFRWQLYEFLHDYDDPKPGTDYLYVSIQAVDEAPMDVVARKGFFFPIEPYFDRP